MKWSVVVCLATPVAILLGSGIAAIVPGVADSLNNSGRMGSQRCYMHIRRAVVITVRLLQALTEIRYS